MSEEQSQQQRFHHKVVTGVLGVVSDRRGRALFVHQTRGPYAGHWLLPGGGIEPGEPAVSAVVREVMEETGLLMEAPRFLALYELLGEWAGGPYHMLLTAFTGTATGEIAPGFVGDNVGGARWAFPAEIPLHSTDLQILTDAGLAAFGAAEIRQALERDRIRLTAYRGVQP